MTRCRLDPELRVHHGTLEVPRYPLKVRTGATIAAAVLELVSSINHSHSPSVHASRSYDWGKEYFRDLNLQPRPVLNFPRPLRHNARGEDIAWARSEVEGKVATHDR